VSRQWRCRDVEEGEQMSEDSTVDPWDTPRISVRVFRHGELIETELCDTEDEATRTVERWSELDDITCEVDDLTVRHRPGDVLEPEPAVLPEDEAPQP
jgi:hypothetical protein